MPNRVLVRPGPFSKLLLRENEVHVWLVQTNDESSPPDDFRDLLSSVELDRAAKFKFETDRRRYITSHAALRSILSNYVNGPARALQFAEGPYGKPKLAPTHATERVEFNLSHSHELALIAVAQ